MKDTEHFSLLGRSLCSVKPSRASFRITRDSGWYTGHPVTHSFSFLVSHPCHLYSISDWEDPWACFRSFSHPVPTVEHPGVPCRADSTGFSDTWQDGCWLACCLYLLSIMASLLLSFFCTVKALVGLEQPSLISVAPPLSIRKAGTVAKSLWPLNSCQDFCWLLFWLSLWPNPAKGTHFSLWQLWSHHHCQWKLSPGM